MMTGIDWAIVVAYLLLTMGIGVVFSRRAGTSLDDYFLAGRNLPWWVAGTSVVATTFASDTPLAVSGLVRSGGIYANWFWWCLVMSGVLSVVFYSRLWRRAALLTDIAFVEMRYSGRGAAALRAFTAVYSGILRNCIIMGWVMLAMAKLGDVVFGLPGAFAVGPVTVPSKALLLAVLTVVALAYTVMSGMWGVVVTDLVQFAVAIAGSFTLAAIVLYRIGGPSAMVAKVTAAPGVNPHVFAFVPDMASAGKLAVFTFAVSVSVQWWATTPAGEYANQRVLAARDERHAMLAMLWGQFCHYVVRTWPWVVVGLASLVFFPLAAGEDPEMAYPRMVMAFLPTGLRGLMVVSFVAAFMSTIDTHLNWGASYLVSDLYKRFVRQGASPAHYVMVSRVVTVLLLVLSALTAWQMDSIAGAWKYLAKLGSGIGLVILLRWFWWRINAWSEISALIASLVLTNVVSLVPALVPDEMFPVQLLVVLMGATAVWVAVTFLTRPTDRSTLLRFYRAVRPGGAWGAVAAEAREVTPERLRGGWSAWLSGVCGIYCALFGVGDLCLARYARGTLLLALATLCGWHLLRWIAGRTIRAA